MLWSIYGTVNSLESSEFTGAVKYLLGCTGRLCQMGWIVVTIKLLSLVLQQPILIGWD